jgi:uncharacterized protein YdeI (YjbR/CyaY-like superfamily)
VVDSIDDLIFADAAAWRRWLEGNHTTRSAVWVVLAKKGAAAPTTLTFDEALAEAVCYGWIDNKTMRRDDTTYRMRFSPRRPRGTWSASNVRLAEALIASGRMQPAGLAEVERARADGRYGANAR